MTRLPESAPNALRRIRRERDLSMEKLGAMVGTDASTINKMEKGQMRLSDKWLPKLADALGVTADELLAAGPAAVVPRRELRPAEIDVPPAQTLPNDVPVKGTAAGSHLRGAFQLDVDTIIDWVRRPPALSGARGAYALYVEGSSMEPRYMPGDLVFVHPDRPPRQGDTVVVQVQVGPHQPIEATIGTLLRRTEKAVTIEKLNPKAEVALARNTIRAIHKVLTINELFGV